MGRVNEERKESELKNEGTKREGERENEMKRGWRWEQGKGRDRDAMQEKKRGKLKQERMSGELELFASFG